MRFWLGLSALGFVVGYLLSVTHASGLASAHLGPFQMDVLAGMLSVGAAFVAPAMIVLLALTAMRLAGYVACLLQPGS
jgi:hypothetical protein